MSDWLITHPPSREPERDFIFRVLLGEFLGLDYITLSDEDACRVTLGRSGERRRRVEVDDVLCAISDADWLAERSMPREPLARWQIASDLPGATRCGDDLPLVYCLAGNKHYFEE